MPDLQYSKIREEYLDGLAIVGLLEDAVDTSLSLINYSVKVVALL